MPGPHFMDLVIFGAGLLGVITLAIHLGHSLPKYTQYIQESNEHYAAGEQETNLEVNCWVPDHFTSSNEQFAESTCYTKFADVLHGRSTAEQARIYPPYIDRNPCDTNDTNCTQPNSFATAIQVVQSQGTGLPEFNGDDLKNGILFATRMLNMLYVFGGIVIVGFVIAVCFSRVAHADTCFLEAAWQSAAEGSNLGSYGPVGEGKEGLLTNTSSVVTRRLAMLADSRKLSINYFVFLVVMIFIFVLLGGMAAHQNNRALKETNNYMDTQISVNTEYKEIRKTRAQKGAAANHGGLTGGQTQREQQGFTGDESQSEIDKLVKELFRPHPTHDSGDLMCDITIRVLGNVHPYTLHCIYKVSRTSDKGQYHYMDMILEVKQASDAACWLAFLMVILLIVHILNFFLLSPMSSQNSLILVMKAIGMDAPSRGLGFGFTDLVFVASFVPMGSRAKYSLKSWAGGV